MKTVFVILIFVFNGAGKQIDTISFDTNITEYEQCDDVAYGASVKLNKILSNKKYKVEYDCKEMNID